MSLKPTVHVVDDDPPVLAALAKLCRVVGFQVESYPSAEGFLERYKPAVPECLVLDVRMPGMDGLAAQKELIRRGITLPIIMITGHWDDDEASEAMEDGAFAVLKKPFRPAELIDSVRRAIEPNAAGV